MKITNFDEIYEFLNRRKRVSRLTFSRLDIVRYVATINAINNLDEDATWFGGAELSKYEVPTFMQDLILPGKISIDGSRQALNLKAAIDARFTVPVEMEEEDDDDDYIDEDDDNTSTDSDDDELPEEEISTRVATRRVQGEFLSCREFNDITQSILAALRFKCDQVTPIKRDQSVTVTSVLDRIAHRDFVHKSSCMPIKLKVGPFNKNGYYGYEASEAIINLLHDNLTSNGNN